MANRRRDKLELFKKLILVCSVICAFFFVMALILRLFFADYGTETMIVPKSINISPQSISKIKLSKGQFNQLGTVKNSDIIYASGIGIVPGSERSFYKSNDRGKTWLMMNTPLITSISAPNQKIVYVGSLKQGVGKTLDGGNTWLPTSLGGVDIIQVQAVDSQTVYAITTDQYVINGGYLYKTDDGGLHWDNIYSSNWSAPITLYAVNKNVVYVGLKRGLINHSKIIKTTDGGASWSTVFVGKGNTRFKRINAVNENTVFVATSTGLFKTLDGGKSWFVCTNNLPASFENKEYGFTDIYAKDAQTIYISYSFPYSVYVTYDGGGYWQNINMGASVTMLGGFNNRLYVGTQMALFELIFGDQNDKSPHPSREGFVE
jgi:photosystem II stability/assembly factor-like uncharacterized protein